MIENSPMTKLIWPEDTFFAENVKPPTLTRFDPPGGTANGASVIVCPGGGYSGLADHEGVPIAEWLNTLGVTAFVLHYRLGPHSRHPEMLNDANRAMRLVRAGAAETGLDPGRIGILGFSAGGHLASTLATHFDAGNPDAAEAIDRVSSRPDIAVLIYPVITLQDPHGHMGSRENLLGKTPHEETVALLSNHLQVSPETPPTFLVHSYEDSAVPPENSLLMALALSAARVPFELHIYEKGEHGYGLGVGDPGVGDWPARCVQWLRGRGFL